MFIQRQVTSINVATPSVTFDLRLWLKAYEIAKSKQLDLVIQLGDFHTLISFLGSIGAVMKGSGLDKLLEPIYASYSVTHIMSVKAVAILLRAHFLVESVLMGLLIEQAPKDEFDTSSLEKIYQGLVQGNLDLNDAESSDIVDVVLQMSLISSNRSFQVHPEQQNYGYNILNTLASLGCSSEQREMGIVMNISML